MERKMQKVISHQQEFAETCRLRRQPVVSVALRLTL